MRASLTIGGIEVALAMPAGGLEASVAERYAPFLGASERPVCSLTLEPSAGAVGLLEPAPTLVERVGGTKFRVVHPGVSGQVDLAGPGIVHVGPEAYAIECALRLLFGLLAPRHDALLLQATSVVTNNAADLLVGPGDWSPIPACPGLTDGLALVRREPTGWLAASTPFRGAHAQLGLPREAKLARMWSLGPARIDVTKLLDSKRARSAIVAHTILPTGEPEIRRAALGLAAQLAEDVPFAELPFAIGAASSAPWTARVADAIVEMSGL